MILKRGFILLAVILLLFSGLIVSGCIEEDEPKNEPKSNRVIRGATFYIDGFDEEKAADEEVIKSLAKIIRNFDVIGLQGIKDPDGKAMQILIEEMNNGTHENGTPYNYQFNLSEMVGRTTCCEEQYAYIYDRDVLYPSSTPRMYSEPDGDVFNRNPYLIAFSAHEGQGQVLFVLLTTDKDNTKQEIDALPQLIENIKKEYAGHENITIVGNLYSDEPYYDKTSDSPLKSEEYVWIITNDMPTTTDGYTYDRIIATSNLKGSYAGKAGVFNFSEEYGLNKAQTEAISKHYPVYVEYWTYPPTL